MKVLIAGTGGRELAIEKKLWESPHIKNILMRPVPDQGFKPLLHSALEFKADLIVVGPEAPLVNGIVDYFAEHAPHIAVFGPRRLAAQLEGSKIYFKTRCKQFGIPTADFDFAGSYPVAERAIKDKGFRVIKADGLAKGKGVVVAKDEPDALEAARTFLMLNGRIVMEERLEGVECSALALCDGVQSVLLPTARDYKRAYDDDTGPNTGGMGAYAPCFDVQGKLLGDIKAMVDLLLCRMRKEGERYFHEQEKVWKDCVGVPYLGMLYAGVMLTKEGPKLLEVNCRFGDPEAQVVLPLVDGDLLPYLVACTRQGGLLKLPPLGWKGGAAVCVCLADKNYPHEGRRQKSIVGVGETVSEARNKVYCKVKAVPALENFHYRTDIAAGI